ncbi:MAG: DUF2723 domain-containing protein [Elusimicrobia bacterium]|nr:DUF2723 domain-containing protein [Elusimicrobiota bacterium]
MNDESQIRINIWLTSFFFIFSFTLYLYTMPPDIAPYRDAGEMAVAAQTLSVAHPPSYPLYILLGHCFQKLPLGSPTFRLNLLSALAGASAVALLFQLISSSFGLGAGTLVASFWMINLTFWHVSQVSEMYSLHVLLILLLWKILDPTASTTSRPKVFLFSFMVALFLGNRSDLLLLLPAILWIFYRQQFFSSKTSLRTYFFALGFFLLGFSIYLYLPIRSNQTPWLNWNNPSHWSNFAASLTRKSYGASLDMLSKQYQTGELFGANLWKNAEHLKENMGWLGLLLCFLGSALQARQESSRWFAIFLAYFFSGPLFLFLANMPPNPHAMAIVEPHYLFSDIFLLFWMAYGIRALLNKYPWAWALCLGQLLVLMIPHTIHSFRRWNFLAQDYAHNVLSSLPPQSLVVARKDVPLFSLWHQQVLLKNNSSIPLLAQGLSGTPWYQDNFNRQYGIGKPISLKQNDPESWEKTQSLLSRRVFATHDTELPNFMNTAPYGLVAEIQSSTPLQEPWPLYVLRGNDRYEEQTDFFSSDLVEAYALGWYRQAAFHITHPSPKEKQGNIDRALYLAWGIKKEFPEIPLSLGILESNRGHWPSAAHFFRRSTQLYERQRIQTEAYHSLPALKDSVRSSSALAYLNLGVSLEKQGKKEEAEKMYQEALERNPQLAEAHYNTAILYWNRDWNRVLEELRETLRLDPNHLRARQALGQVERRGK